MQKLITPRRGIPHSSQATISLWAASTHRFASSDNSKAQSEPAQDHDSTKKRDDNYGTSTQEKKAITVEEKDEELRLKMSGLSGDGGAAGIEYEDGKPVALKRSVKNNMFRYI
ncbi:hypothetical protein F5X99DRAFT_394976 [Biscogniauxia marginata]|nr:hypothetical protein F5X99DRAFT_394976 [Biscogniauxia marginata]